MECPSPRTGLLREATACLRLAGPLILAQIAFVGMIVTDTLMAGHLSATDLAAVALGSAVWTPLYLFFMGICMAVSPFVAQLVGAGTHRAVGPYLHQALYFAIALSTTWWLLLRGCGLILTQLEVSADIRALSIAYLHAMAWGTPAACLFFVLRFTSEGLGRTRPVMGFAFLGLLVNAAADYVLMYGAFGAPALGAEGCGWATALTLWVMALGLTWFVTRNEAYCDLDLLSAWQRPRARNWLETLRVGLPIGISIFMEASLFATVGLLMAQFGAAAVAAHQVAINFTALTFMIPVGLALATTIRVGQAAGRGDPQGVRTSGRTGIGIALGVMLFPALLMGLLPKFVVELYTNAPEVARLAEGFLRLAALFQLWDGLQVTASGALRGLKDTRVPMLITFFAYWCVGLPLGAYLAFAALKQPAGLWWGLIAGLAVAAALLNLRFYQKTRRGRVRV
jgi:multidrug resistance protein, MATE family